MRLKGLSLLGSLLLLLGLGLSACGDNTPTTAPATTVAASTTAPATTAAPTTAAPTTVAPTTAQATTVAPTTAQATTVAPTTAASTTAATTTAAANTTPATAATGGENKVVATYTLVNTPLGTFQNGLLSGSITNDRKVLLGAIGSDLWRSPTDPPGVFWMVADRGPNGEVKVGDAKRRTFAVPEYNPVIVQVKTEGTTLSILKALPIVGQSGKPVTGLPNLESRDEVPYDYSGQTKLNYNVNGLDPEGLVRTSAGDFWIVEEYGPSLLHLDATGKILKRYVPQGVQLDGADYPVSGTLPAIYGKRKQNRGFEALTISKDEKTLYVGLQSPLHNPDKKIGDASRQTRILVFDLASEKAVAEYVYRLEPAKEFEPKAEATDMKVSAIALVNPTTLLVDERTDPVAKLYLVDLSKATNILGSKWDDAATTPSLEATTDLESIAVVPLAKSLVIDLSKHPEVPAKIEGISILDRNTIAIANDNDFEISDFDKDGNLVGTGEKSKILIINLAKPLPLP